MLEVNNYFNMSMYELVASSGFSTVKNEYKLTDYNTSDIHLYGITREASHIMRSVLASTIFRSEEFQAEFMETFNKVFPCVKYQYDPYKSIYTFRVKKTAVKKIQNYSSTSEFYYPFIADMVSCIIKQNKLSIMQLMMLNVSIHKHLPAEDISIYEFCSNTIDVLTSHQGLLSCLFDVQCISDNIVQVRI